MKIALFTATTTKRANDPYLKPCRDRRKEYHDRNNVLLYENMRMDLPLGEIHEEGRQWALRDNCTHFLILDDDELPDLTMIDDFIKWSSRCKVMSAVKALRPFSCIGRGVTRKGYPLKWIFLHSPEHVINDRIMRIEDIGPDKTSTEPYEVLGGSFASPTWIDLSVHIPFRGDKSFDQHFADDCYSQNIPFSILRWITIQHYCADTHNIYV